MTDSPARRVATLDDIERAGDYSGPHLIEDSYYTHGVWFLLPTHKGSDKFDRPDEHSGIHGIYAPTWTFMEHEDGSLSASPSIGCGVSPYYWHGYLMPGNIWRQI